MALGCNCNLGLSNTGKPGCLPIQSVTSGLIMVPLNAADGTANFIDLDAALPTWADLINEADPSKRWFPLQGFENVELPKADTIFEEANSGRMVYIRQGTRDSQRITFDLQLKASEPWAVVVENEKFYLNDNEALIFAGTQQIHWRENKKISPDAEIDMIFCHLEYVKDTPLDPGQKDLLDQRALFLMKETNISNEVILNEA